MQTKLVTEPKSPQQICRAAGMLCTAPDGSRPDRLLPSQAQGRCSRLYQLQEGNPVFILSSSLTIIFPVSILPLYETYRDIIYSIYFTSY